MMRNCSVVEDLLPLYHEGLLQKETVAQLEEHLTYCEWCREKSEISAEPIVAEKIESPVNHEKMMAKNQFKVSMFQLLFIGISFFLALQSVIVKQDFSFILPYTILGFVTYLFYKKYKIVVLISFLPVFLWYIGMMFYEYPTSADVGIGRYVFDMVQMTILISIIHLLFAVIGATIALATIKLFEKEEI